MTTTSFIRNGRAADPPDPMVLRAGPLTLLFEPDTAFLRNIRCGDTEIVRAIYAAVRDHNWGTVAPELSELHVEDTDDSFRVAFDARCCSGDIAFLWRGGITGDADGTIRFTLDGVAQTTFRRNRIGFCVLHPMALAGQVCVLEKTDGTRERRAFPRTIAPHQPFTNLRAITYTVRPGLRAEVCFDGDVFETEDQRNWTDASFKTYGTPLALPFPVVVTAGTTIRQAVTLTLRGKAPKVSVAASADKELVRLTDADGPARPLPALGLGMAAGPDLDARQLKRLRALNLAHLRADLHLNEPDWKARWERAAREARALDVPLEAAIFPGENVVARLRVLRRETDHIRPKIARWLILHDRGRCTGESWVLLMKDTLGDYDPQAEIGGGTNAYFTQLNRHRPAPTARDFLSYSINPQVHAFDDRSLVENLAAQAETVRSARRFARGKKMVVTPVTLRPRFNPNATGPAAPHTLPRTVDARQMSLLGAGWTLGSIKCLAEAGANSVTYYETVGARGVMETEDGPPLPGAFPCPGGAVFPLYHVLADVGEFRGGLVRPLVSSDPLRADALALEKDGRLRILVANLTPRAQTVLVPVPASSAEVTVLDETNALAAMTEPEAFRAAPGEPFETRDKALRLDLRPFAVARVDSAARVQP